MVKRKDWRWWTSWKRSQTLSLFLAQLKGGTHLSCTGFGGSKQSWLKLHQFCRPSVSSRRTLSLTSVNVRLCCFWQRWSNQQRSWTLESETNNKAPQKNNRTSDAGEAFPPIWQYLSMKFSISYDLGGLSDSAVVFQCKHRRSWCSVWSSATAGPVQTWNATALFFRDRTIEGQALMGYMVVIACNLGNFKAMQRNDQRTKKRGQRIKCI